MKNFKLVLLAVIVGFLVSCNNDDNNYKSIGLNGTWNLVRISTPVTGESEEIDVNDVVWTFNEAKRKITIADSREMQPQENGINASVTYDYNIVNWGEVCNEALSFNQKQYGCITIEENNLTISTSATDGPVYRLTR